MKILNTFLLLIIFSISVFAQATKPVTIAETEETFLMENGIVVAVISKKSGGLVSLKYEGIELLMLRSNGVGAQWSHDAKSPEVIKRITIDPASNSGERGEVSVKGISGGRPMGDGPGGSFVSDIEIRYALERGAHGIYTYSIFDHLPEYPATTMGEARFVAFLHKDFDYMLVDERRSKMYRIKDGELDLSKYEYTSNIHENPVFGWVNTSNGIGFWLINPTLEYMSGGPTKNEFLGHRDTRVNGAPVFLNYWRSSHYGGSSVDVAAGEKWAKMIGPIMLYANKSTYLPAQKRDAIGQQVVEREKFPYAWVNAKEFPLKEQRGTVSGKLVLKDPLTKNFTRLRVGLTAPDYIVNFRVIPVAPAPPPHPGDPPKFEPRTVDWQFDAKNYQFWTVAKTSGEFAIKNVRPGKYTLHAIADGVLGEYVKTEITVEEGKSINLGDIDWTPVRRGKQIWEIGVNNRNASEFLGGDKFYVPAYLKQYPVLFPTGVNYTVGKSDFTKDWFYAHVPFVENPEAPENTKSSSYPDDVLARAFSVDVVNPAAKQMATDYFASLGRNGRGAMGKASTWTITFNLPKELKGNAVLRLGIAGTGTRELSVGVNGKDAGGFKDLRIDGTINRTGESGLWYERELVIDRTLFQKGENKLTLTVPPGQVVNGIMYDYLRLEEMGN